MQYMYLIRILSKAFEWYKLYNLNAKGLTMKPKKSDDNLIW